MNLSRMRKFIVISLEVAVLVLIGGFFMIQIFSNNSQLTSYQANPFIDNSRVETTEFIEVTGLDEGDSLLAQGNITENLETAMATPTAIVCGPGAGWDIYQVRDGDTLDQLADKFQIPVEELQVGNCMGTSSIIMNGQTLYVPKLAPTQSAVVALSENSDKNAPISNDESNKTDNTKSSDTEESQNDVQAPTQEATIDPGQTVRDVPDRIEVSYTKITDFISNPGIGWQYAFGDESAMTSAPETVAYSLRGNITWKKLNPGDGVYDWSELDRQMGVATSQGKQYSFRVMQMIGDYWGDHAVPQWVLNKGAVILDDGEPDYSNCVYQAEWGKFVNALVDRYDGNSNIAFVDISGYGEFGEWSWGGQTEWDYTWADHYKNGTANSKTMSELDSYARRRLADIFIGGSFTGHQCRDKNNNVSSVDYSYSGFQQTQLVMPNAGIWQSNEYVYLKRKDVGFRYDCLGRDGSKSILKEFGQEISVLWPKVPIVYETCGPNDFSFDTAQFLLWETHGTLVHNPRIDVNANQIEGFVRNIGYKYYLQKASHDREISKGGSVDLKLYWINEGSAPSYPKMGQNFVVKFYLLNSSNAVIGEYIVPVDVSSWMPAANSKIVARPYLVEASVDISDSLPAGTYFTKVAIINTRTGKPINLANNGKDAQGLYSIAQITVRNN